MDLPSTSQDVALIAEVIILVFALVVAVVRALPGPALLPFRLLGTLYVDVFRGVPTILVIYLLGLGVRRSSFRASRVTRFSGALRPLCSATAPMSPRSTALVSSQSIQVNELPPVQSDSRALSPCATSSCRRRSAEWFLPY